MKVGDLIRFSATGAIAMMIEMVACDYDTGGYVSIYVSDGTLDNTPSHDGFTHMSYKVLSRTAEVISGSR